MSKPEAIPLLARFFSSNRGKSIKIVGNPAKKHQLKSVTNGIVTQSMTYDDVGNVKATVLSSVGENNGQKIETPQLTAEA